MAQKRQLAAIMFADIVGYSSLMEENEGLAILSRQKLKKILFEETGRYNGKILEFRGDGALCIFNSDIECVNAAIDIQKKMRIAPSVALRIGIHSGDIIVDGKNVYGEGVNVASRVESFAVSGGIFITGKVHDNTKNQDEIKTVSLGLFDFKNVKLPVEIFAVSNSGLVVPTNQILEGKGIHQSHHKSSYRKTWIALSLLALTLVTIGLFAIKIVNSSGRRATVKSIAVLPMTNLSPDKNDEYFSMGTGNEIISQLSKIKSLRVISQLSASNYKNSNKTIQQFGKELKADYLLEGSVQKVGDRIQIQLQLINVKADENIWAHTYDRQLDNLFTIQSDIANDVAKEFNATLSTEEQNDIDDRSTENSVAFQLYLQGTYFLDKRTPQGMLRSQELFEQAIAADSNYANAYVGLASSFIFRSNFYNMDPKEGYPQAKMLISKALEINPNLSEAHAAQGIIKGFHNWNMPMAEVEFKKALRIDRNNKLSRLGYGRCLYSSKKWNEAIKVYNEALESDPLWRQPLNSLAWVYFFQNNYSRALYYIKKNQEINPDFFQPFRLEGLIYLNQGKRDEALRLFKKSVELSGNNPEELAYLGYGYAKTGQDTEANKIIDELLKLQGGSRILSFPISMVYAGFENKLMTFKYLEMAAEEKTADIMLVNVFPQFDFLKSDPAYKDFLMKSGIIFLN